MSQEGKLTKSQKAAAILVAMGKPSAGKLLRFFKHGELKALIEAARSLRTIPQSELENIVAEFEDEFTEGAGLLDSGDQMDTILNESLSPEEISALMGRGGQVRSGEPLKPVWPDLEQLSPERLGKLLGAEHPQTIAMVFTQLGAEVASGALLTFPKPLRSDVLRRMMSMRAVQPGARRLVEGQLREMLEKEKGGTDISAGHAKVANLLNEMDKEHLDELVADLEASGAGGIEAVKARLFSFEDIVHLTPKARVMLFDGLDTELVTTALREVSGDLLEAALTAISPRSRRMIESELSIMSETAPQDAIARARKRIAATAIELAASGQIELPSAKAAA